MEVEVAEVAEVEAVEVEVAEEEVQHLCHNLQEMAS